MLFLRKTDETIWKPAFLRVPHPLFLSNIFMTRLFVQISKMRYPLPPNFRGVGRKLYYLNLLLPWSSNCFAVAAHNLLPLQSIISNFKTLIPECHPLVQIFFCSCQVFFGLSVCLFSQWDILSMAVCVGWLSARCKMRPVNVMCLFLTCHRDLWTLHSLVYLLLTSLWFCEESWDCTYLEDW